jgi:hypothetical protein
MKIITEPILYQDTPFLELMPLAGVYRLSERGEKEERNVGKKERKREGKLKNKEIQPILPQRKKSEKEDKAPNNKESVMNRRESR